MVTRRKTKTDKSMTLETTLLEQFDYIFITLIELFVVIITQNK